MHLFNFVACGCQRQWSSRLQSTDDLGRLHRDEVTRAGNFERRIEMFATHHKSMATKCTLAATTTNAPDNIVN
jgi:hypothetical protein